jgi:MFS transporter, NNP family, nitrate/nitrite transporter
MSIKPGGISEQARANIVLTMNTLAFAVCFACWMMNAVLITFLVINGYFDWDAGKIGILMATPVLTGSILRLPVGVLTDRFGGRIVYFVLMIVSAIALLLNSFANSYITFVLSGLGFGIAGASFAVGVAYTSTWFRKERQGTALGIFGTGNAGTAITLLFAPKLLQVFTSGGANPEGWRMLPRVYACALAVTAVAFWFLTWTRVAPQGAGLTLAQRLAPMKHLRVWRFGLYYFLLFGGFVALSNWLVPYYVNSYAFPIATAGLFATMFSLPTGLFRAVGGWLADRYGARSVLYLVLTVCCLCTFALFFPRMDITTPGVGILAKAPGKIVSMSGTEMVIENPKTQKRETYHIKPQPATTASAARGSGILPSSMSWQTWAGKAVDRAGSASTRPFQVGDTVKQRELLAAGTTAIHFEANVYVFTLIVFLMGISMGVGMAAVYKHIPTYFPADVGVVGGLVGVIGGLGGFFCPILFGYLLQATGIWTSCWMFLFALAVVCLVWMHIVVRRITVEASPATASLFETR